MSARYVQREHNVQPLVIEFPGYAGEYVDAGEKHCSQARRSGIKAGLKTGGFSNREFADEQAGADQQCQGQQGRVGLRLGLPGKREPYCAMMR